MNKMLVFFIFFGFFVGGKLAAVDRTISHSDHTEQTTKLFTEAANLLQEESCFSCSAKTQLTIITEALFTQLAFAINHNLSAFLAFFVLWKADLVNLCKAINKQPVLSSWNEVSLIDTLTTPVYFILDNYSPLNIPLEIAIENLLEEAAERIEFKKSLYLAQKAELKDRNTQMRRETKDRGHAPCPNKHNSGKESKNRTTQKGGASHAPKTRLW